MERPPGTAKLAPSSSVQSLLFPLARTGGDGLRSSWCGLQLPWGQVLCATWSRLLLPWRRSSLPWCGWGLALVLRSRGETEKCNYEGECREVLHCSFLLFGSDPTTEVKRPTEKRQCDGTGPQFPCAFVAKASRGKAALDHRRHPQSRRAGQSKPASRPIADRSCWRRRLLLKGFH